MKPSLSGSFINHHNTGFQTAIFISPLGPSQDEEEVHEERQEFGAQLQSSAGASQQTLTASASATRPPGLLLGTAPPTHARLT